MPCLTPLIFTNTFSEMLPSRVLPLSLKNGLAFPGLYTKSTPKKSRIQPDNNESKINIIRPPFCMMDIAEI
jgi:hypothetical protein